MGTYSEIEIEINIDNKATDQQIVKFKEDIIKNKEIDGKLTFDKDYCLTLFISSQRTPNMDYQLEELKKIMEKHKDIILDANGNVMVESDSNFSFGEDD